MKIILLFVVSSISFFGLGQLSVPYYNTFDSPTDTTGWSHFAITGTDDWEMGTPSGQHFTAAFSYPGAWCTNLEGLYTANSSRVLVTPSFDFSTLPSNYSLSFQQKRYANSAAHYYLEYSINNGSTWAVLDNASSAKKNWQTAAGFTSGSYLSFINSAINLGFLQGQANVKFRFRFVSTIVNDGGWLIDNFSINQEYYNIYAIPGDTIYSSPLCSGFTVSTILGFDNAYSQAVNNTTNYYLSYDPVLDANDVLLGTKVSSVTNSVSGWDKSFSMIPNLNSGDYYIFYQHDALNALTENNESDNTAYAVLHLDSIYGAPFTDDFETIPSLWKPRLESIGTLYWELGSGISHHLEGAYSGTKAWNTSKSILEGSGNCGYTCNLQYLESPYFNTTGMNSPSVNFWYKSTPNSTFIAVEATTDCGETWTEVWQPYENTEGIWRNANLLLFSPQVSPAIRFRIKYNDSYGSVEGFSMDDFYLGEDLADLSMNDDLANRSTKNSANSYTLKYRVSNNCADSSVMSWKTQFYWSNDTILDASDILVGTKDEDPIGPGALAWMTYDFVKPTLQNGVYYIFYKLDALSEVNEKRENNNIGYFTIYQTNGETVPYLNDFETGIDGWHHNSTLAEDDWNWETPNGTVLNEAFSGNKAFTTLNDSGYVSPLSRMHLYTPVFDFTNTQRPVIYFDMKLDAEGNCDCYDANTNMSYSLDGGATWEVLDTTNSSYNRWYYSMVEEGSGTDVNYYIPNGTNIMIEHGPENVFATYGQYNSKDVIRNTRYILDIGFLAGEPSVQFRYNLVTNFNPHHAEGALIDNFSIKESFIDLSVDYKKAIMNSSEANHLKFYMNISNNGLSISNPSTVNFYLSSDTLLSAGDYLLGHLNLKAIQPDKSDYINNAFPSPQNIDDYKYLVYEIDPNHSNTESNETNNVGYWLLALDSIHEYPYFNDFNDTIVDGWYQYSTGPYADTISDLRFRNIFAPGEPEYHSYRHSGEWFTDRSTYGNGDPAPKFFLQTPSFSFENIDSVKLSFDLFCTGGSTFQGTSGGQMQFSTDGGNTFNVLTSQYGANHNWYNVSPSIWWFSNIYLDTAILDSTYFDLTFLRGEKNVVLQYTFSANEIQANVPQGLRMDNFLIEGIQLDYAPLDSLVDIAANLSMSTININYNIANIGEKDGRESLTKFYWSQDSILSPDDILLDSIDELPILMNDTLIGNISINYPTPIQNQVYYVLYMTDWANNVKETNERNNVGSYRVTFDAFINYRPVVPIDSVTILDNATTVSVDYSVENAGYLDGPDFNTTFYWSLDENFDGGDELIYTHTDGQIASQTTLNSSALLDCQLPLIQNAYYIFYAIDESNEITESNDNDNIGSIKVLVQSTASVPENTSSLLLIGSNGNDVFITSNMLSDQLFELKLTNMLGQEIFSGDIILQAGTNKIEMPERLNFGMYMLYLINNKDAIGWKIMLDN